MRTPNGRVTKAAGAASTEAIHVELLGLAVQLHGASALPVPGAQSEVLWVSGRFLGAIASSVL